MAHLLRSFPALIFTFVASLLTWCMVGPSAVNSLYEFSADGWPPENPWVTTPPIDTLLAAANWADWAWLAAHLETIEAWVADPDRAEGLLVAGVVVLSIGFVLFFATNEVMSEALLGSWLGALLLRSSGIPCGRG